MGPQKMETMGGVKHHCTVVPRITDVDDDDLMVFLYVQVLQMIAG